MTPAPPPRLMRRLMAALFAGPGLAVLALLVLAPMLIMLGYSFFQRDAFGNVVGPATTGNYARFVGLVGEGGGIYLGILLRSVLLGAAVTACCVLIGYPYAFFVARSRFRVALLALTVLPFWTNFLIRVYAWMVVLQRKGVANAALEAVGLEPLRLYPSVAGVVLVSVYTYLPFLVLPVCSAVGRIDDSLAEAARDLGAGWWASFRHAVFPQTSAALAAGALLVFVPATGIYVIADLVGAGKTMFIGNLVAQQFSTARDWPFGAAAAFLLTGITLLALALLLRLGRRSAVVPA